MRILVTFFRNIWPRVRFYTHEAEDPDTFRRLESGEVRLLESGDIRRLE